MSLVVASAVSDNLLPLAMVILAIGIGMWTLRKAHQRSQQRPPARDVLESVREEREVRQSMDTMMVELEEFARRVNAQIDTKSAKLEQLIRDADDRLDRLRHAEPQPVEQQPTVDQTVDDAPPAPVLPRDEHSAHICSLADAGQAPLQIAEQMSMPVGEVELVLRLHGRAG